MSRFPFNAQPIPSPSKLLAYSLIVALFAAGIVLYLSAILYRVPAAALSAANHPQVEAYLLAAKPDTTALTFDQILALGADAPFTALKSGAVLSAINDYPSQGHWYRFHFSNPYSHPRHFVLDLAQPFYNQAILYMRSYSGEWEANLSWHACPRCPRLHFRIPVCFRYRSGS